jgi:hypothetical protein
LITVQSYFFFLLSCLPATHHCQVTLNADKVDSCYD